jgi:hypothetical protein
LSGVDILEFCFRPFRPFAIQNNVMRSIFLFLLVIALWCQSGGGVSGAEFRLTNGDVHRGDVASVDDDGLVIRLDIGGFSTRIGWGKLTQETLKELAKNPQAARFVEAFIEAPPEPPKEKAVKKRDIVVKPVPRLERLEKTSVFASYNTPGGLAILIVLFLANIYAAYEIAVFRNRPAALVCGISAILPVVGPIVFLSLPTAGEEGDPEHGMAPAGAPGDVLASGGAVAQAKKTGPTPSGLSVAAPKLDNRTEAPLTAGGVYKRGDTTFNRRFFETKFAGLFRVVPSEAEKDLVLVIRAAKNEYIAKRITRIATNEMHVQTLRGGTEAMIPFGEIIEVQVRHKDAKG